MSKIKYFWQQSWLLIVASFFFGLLIAVTNVALSDRIALNEQEKLHSLMRSLMPDADSFEKALAGIKITAAKGRIVSTDIYKAVDDVSETAGYAFVAEGSGFQDKIKLVIAMDAQAQKFLGYRVLFNNETPGFGSKITEDFLVAQFIDVPTEELELVKTPDAAVAASRIVTITGATVSSQAVVDIFNAYTQSVKELLRSEGLINDVR
jgi:Na+-translocating ferredoxin:NAD+ oxidoreductase subunit G